MFCSTTFSKFGSVSLGFKLMPFKKKAPYKQSLKNFTIRPFNQGHLTQEF